jgi:hypothetical protein
MAAERSGVKTRQHKQDDSAQPDGNNATAFQKYIVPVAETETERVRAYNLLKSVTYDNMYFAVARTLVLDTSTSSRIADKCTTTDLRRHTVYAARAKNSVRPLNWKGQ